MLLDLDFVVYLAKLEPFAQVWEETRDGDIRQARLGEYGMNFYGYGVDFRLWTLKPTQKDLLTPWTV